MQRIEVSQTGANMKRWRYKARPQGVENPSGAGATAGAIEVPPPGISSPEVPTQTLVSHGSPRKRAMWCLGLIYIGEEAYLCMAMCEYSAYSRSRP